MLTAPVAVLEAAAVLVAVGSTNVSLTLILLVSVAAIQGIGTKVGQIFTSVNNSLTT